MMWVKKVVYSDYKTIYDDVFWFIRIYINSENKLMLVVYIYAHWKTDFLLFILIDVC